MKDLHHPRCSGTGGPSTDPLMAPPRFGTSESCVKAVILLAHLWSPATVAFPKGDFHKDFVLTLGRLGHRVKGYSEIRRN